MNPWIEAAETKLISRMSNTYPSLMRRIVITKTEEDLTALLTVNNRLVSATFTPSQDESYSENRKQLDVSQFAAYVLFQIRQTKYEVGSHRSEI